MFLMGALAVEVRSALSIGTAGFGAAVAVFYVAAASSSAPGGLLAEKWGAVTVMRLSASLSLASLGGVALVARSFGGAVLGMVVAGLANGMGQPAANLLLAGSTAPGRRGTAFGIKQSAIPIATLLAGLAVPAIALTIGWRWAFAAACLVPIAGWALLPRRSEELPHRHVDAGGRNGLAMKALVMLAIGGALGSAAGNSLGTFLVMSTVSDGLHPGMAGLLSAAGSAAGLVSRLASGVAADRRRGRHLVVVAAMLAVGSAGFAFLATGSIVLLLPGALIAFAAGWGWNGLFNLAVVTSHPHAPAAATGISQTGVLVGGATGPLLFGVAVQHGSFPLAWGCSAAAVLLASVALLWGRVLLRRAA